MSLAEEDSSAPAHGDNRQTVPFSDLVRTARLRVGQCSQQALATKVGKTKQWITGIEKNDLPAIEQVVKLHDALLEIQDPEHFDPRDPKHSPTRAFWLLTWLKQHAKRSTSGTPDEHLASSLNEAVRLFPGQLATSVPRSKAPLADFPAAFDRIAVISGDRREVPAHSGGDLFVDSASVLDLRFLNDLCLGGRNAPIWHDKVFVQMDDVHLRGYFGRTNLVVVGSPAVNLAARYINDYSLFRFNVARATRLSNRKVRSTFPPPKTYADERMLRGERREGVFRLQDRSNVAKLDSVLRALEEPSASASNDQRLVDTVQKILEPETRPSEWIRQFRPLSIVDPANNELHKLPEKPEERLHEDYALVSLAANPFADPDQGYVAIFVAGIHGPGTAHALRALRSMDFSDRPFGGVLKVTLKLDGNLPERVIDASTAWLTRTYDVDDKGIVELEAHVKSPPGDVAQNWEDELEDWSALPRKLRSALDR